MDAGYDADCTWVNPSLEFGFAVPSTIESGKIALAYLHHLQCNAIKLEVFKPPTLYIALTWPSKANYRPGAT